MRNFFLTLLFLFSTISDAEQNEGIILKLRFNDSQKRKIVLQVSSKFKTIKFDPFYNLTYIVLIPIEGKKLENRIEAEFLYHGFPEEDTDEKILKGTKREFIFDLNQLILETNLKNQIVLKGKYRVSLQYFIDKKTYGTDSLLMEIDN